MNRLLGRIKVLGSTIRSSNFHKTRCRLPSLCMRPSIHVIWTQVRGNRDNLYMIWSLHAMWIQVPDSRGNLCMIWRLHDTWIQVLDTRGNLCMLTNFHIMWIQVPDTRGNNWRKITCSILSLCKHQIIHAMWIKVSDIRDNTYRTIKCSIPSSCMGSSLHVTWIAGKFKQHPRSLVQQTVNMMTDTSSLCCLLNSNLWNTESGVDKDLTIQTSAEETTGPVLETMLAKAAWLRAAVVARRFSSAAFQ